MIYEGMLSLQRAGKPTPTAKLYYNYNYNYNYPPCSSD